MSDWPDFAPTAKGHCELMAFAHKQLRSGLDSVEGFLLPFGEEFSDAYLPDHLEVMEPRMCFMNCFELAGMMDDLTYCEGFVLLASLPIPIHHAWCVDEEGRVVEPTITEALEELTFFGVRLPFGAVNEVVEDTETYSVLFKRFGHEVVERICGKEAQR
jgi:hypothetical protein